MPIRSEFGNDRNMEDDLPAPCHWQSIKLRLHAMLDLFRSLRKRLDREEREWRDQNRIRSELDLSLWHSLMLRLASRFVLFGVILFIAAVAVSLGVIVTPDSYWVLVVYEKFAIIDRVDHFSALLAAQASLVALVYPIVIAFVALLIGQRSSAVSLLHIYIHDSCALFAGLSSLLLVAVMCLQFIALNYINDSVLGVWLVVDALWFFGNIVLTLYFLGRSFEFLRSERRAEIVRTYAISVAWPVEARLHLGRHFFSCAIGENLLPGAVFDGTNKDPSLMLGMGAPEMGEAVLEKDFGERGKMLSDIRFRPLSIAVWLWERKAVKHVAVAPKAEPAWYDSATGPVMSFPVDPFDRFEGVCTICRVQNGPKPSATVRWLIARSFVFRRASRREKLSISTILSDLQTDAVSALRQGDHEAFEATTRQLIKLYLSLLVASRVADSSGRMANMSELRDASFFERPIYEVWSRKLIELFSMASKRLPESHESVSFLAYLPARLISRCGDDVTLPMLKSFLEMGPILFRRIEDWWSSAAEGESQKAHGPCSPGVLRAPLFGVHNSVLQDFVESWEHVKGILPPKGKASPDWASCRNSMALLEAHIGHTAVMLLDCVRRGDSRAADWIVDVLLKWYGEIRHQFDDSRLFAMKRRHLLDAALFELEWNEARTLIEYETFGGPTQPTPSACLLVCVQNAWIDVCCLAIYSLIQLSESCDCENSLAARVAAAIIKGDPLLHGAEGSAQSPYHSLDELLTAYIRQTSGSQRYTGALDSVVERIAEQGAPSRVSGRIYSRVGSDDVGSLQESQLIALLLAAPETWHPSRTVAAQLGELARSDRNKYARLRRIVDQWIAELQNGLSASAQRSFECIRQRAGLGVPLASAVASLLNGLQQLTQEVARARTNAIALAPISPERLLAISGHFSSRAFTPEGQFPVPLFEVLEVEEETDLASVTCGLELKRGELTDPPMADIAANESDWLSEIGSSEIAASVLGRALFQLQPITRRGATPRTYWSAIKKFAAGARANNLDPLLIVANPTDPGWLWDWANPIGDQSTSPPRDLRIDKNDAGKLSQYEFSLNGMDVYEGPVSFGQSVLVARQSFVRVEVFRNQDGLLVGASTREIEGDPEHVELLLTWKLRVVVQTYPSLFLTHSP
jgi:hypothetical protein